MTEEVEEKTFADEVAEVQSEEDQQDIQEKDESEEENSEDSDTQEEDEEEKEKLRKQEEYRERQKKKREEEQQRKAEKVVQDEAGDDREIEELKQMAREQKFTRMVNQAEQELIQLEKPFKEAFTDYDDVVSNALAFTKIRLTADGMTESQADAYLRQEKVLLADRAAAQGLDPVEAVYNEAKSIMSTVDKFAEQMGYTKGRPKTNLQAVKEMSKPNAFSGGVGKGAKNQIGFNDMGDEDLDDIDNFTLGDLGLGR